MGIENRKGGAGGVNKSNETGTLRESDGNLNAAGQDQLDAWLDSLVLAANLDDVFDLRSRH